MKQVYILLVLIFGVVFPVVAQQDSVSIQHDSTVKHAPVETAPAAPLPELLKTNRFLNSTGTPVSLIASPRAHSSKDIFFYFMAFIVLMLGILKVSYSRYFSNLFRVFFNTSLRQSQLTDQLLQAKLPSLLFNILYVITGGWYIYFLLVHFAKIERHSNIHVLFLCMAGILVIYLTKFCMLKFTGWVTGYKTEAETYIFIVFLINKIIAVCLIPLIVIMAFSNQDLARASILLSFILIGIMLLMRFFRSFDLLQSKIKVSGLHFLMYIAGAEILPLLLIYKAVVLLISKNL